jgi:hypothetical protein
VLCVQDQIVPVAVLSVLWTSIDPKEHKKLSALKVRQWSGQLLDRSILIGNSDGISMHDVSEYDHRQQGYDFAM